MQAVGECGGKFSSSKRIFVNTTQEAAENGDWVETLELGTVGENIGDWPLSSDWNSDDNPDVGEVHGNEVTAQPEVLGNNKRVTLSPRPQSEEPSIGYFMALLQKDIEDGDCLHADHETTDALVSRDSFEPAPATDNEEEEVESQDMPNLMAFWNL